MKPASVIIMDEHPIVRMSIEVLLQKKQKHPGQTEVRRQPRSA